MIGSVAAFRGVALVDEAAGQELGGGVMPSGISPGLRPSRRFSLADLVISFLRLVEGLCEAILKLAVQCSQRVEEGFRRRLLL